VCMSADAKVSDGRRGEVDVCGGDRMLVISIYGLVTGKKLQWKCSLHLAKGIGKMGKSGKDHQSARIFKGDSAGASIQANISAL